MSPGRWSVLGDEGHRRAVAFDAVSATNALTSTGGTTFCPVVMLST